MTVNYSDFKKFIEMNSDLTGDELEEYARKEWEKWIAELRNANGKALQSDR